LRSAAAVLFALLLAELRSLDRKRKTCDAELAQALADHGTCLMNIDGIGPVAAATIIAIVGDVQRFPNPDHFASFTGTAPVAASSGERVRYRLNLGGQRQMNKVLHIAARVQISLPNSPGRAYIHRKLAEGKTRAEAIRSLKRHLSNAVYRALQADLATREVSGEDNQAA
jgi:transposase